VKGEEIHTHSDKPHPLLNFKHALFVTDVEMW